MTVMVVQVMLGSLVSIFQETGYVVGVGVGECPGDYLEISDGSSSKSYCGTSPPAPLTTTNTITVKLHLVDYDVSGTGFLATACCSVGVTTDVSTGEWWL